MLSWPYLPLSGCHLIFRHFASRIRSKAKLSLLVPPSSFQLLGLVPAQVTACVLQVPKLCNAVSEEYACFINSDFYGKPLRLECWYTYSVTVYACETHL